MFHLKNHFLAVCIYLWVCGLCVLPAFGQADPGGALPVPGGNFLRSEVSAALDNPSLQFTLRDPDYWTVSHDHFQIGGSSMYVDLGFPDDPPLWSTILEAEISGPALLSYWVYLERVNIAHTFGEIDPDPDNHQGLKWDGDLPSTNVASFGDSSLTWVRVNFAIPGGTYQVGWRFGGWFVGGAAYLDQVMLMSLEGDWGYMVNPDGNTVTVHTFLTEPRQSWEEPVPIALNIPATLGGKPVTAIGEAAFSNMFLSELSLPNTLTTIGAGAFRGCHGVTEVTVPASVTTLGADVWAEFDGLKYVIFTGARPAASAEPLGSQAYILYPAGQAGWVDGGTYRGLTTLAWSGTRVPEPQFSREANSNPEAFYYYIELSQLVRLYNDFFRTPALAFGWRFWLW